MKNEKLINLLLIFYSVIPQKSFAYFRHVQKVKLFFRYLLYWFHSTNEHGIHSPFVFDLLTQTIYIPKLYYAFNTINKIRKRNLEDQTIIFVDDFGAGSIHSNSNKKKISHIAKYAAKPQKYGELLFRLVNKFSPHTLLELGTSIGVSGMYMASACRKSQFITIEASTEIAKVAQQNFDELCLENAQLISGTFEDKLIEACKKLGRLDFVFFDGNHQKKPTLSYFIECLKYRSNESVFVFDDIHWSDEMQAAWKEIKSHPEVTVTLDLFFMGIVFFRKEQAKEHFIIRF